MHALKISKVGMDTEPDEVMWARVSEITKLIGNGKEPKSKAEKLLTRKRMRPYFSMCTRICISQMLDPSTPRDTEGV